jgi:hypothetical protein
VTTTITFGTAEHVDPVNLAKNVRPGEIPDEDKSILIPEPFSMQRPAHVQIEIQTEHFKDSHFARQVESIAQTSDNVADVSDAASNVSQVVHAGGSPSHVRQQLGLLYHTLHSIYGAQQPALTPTKEDQDIKPPPESRNDDDSEESWSVLCPLSYLGVVCSLVVIF